MLHCGDDAPSNRSHVTAGVRESHVLGCTPDGPRVVHNVTACEALDRQYLILKAENRVSPPPLK
jgi:hypothetical protein